jgi:hypothetical protein
MTLVVVAIDGRAAGVLAAANSVRPSAAQAIRDLKALGIEPVMMTDDSRRTAEESRPRSASTASLPKCCRKTRPLAFGNCSQKASSRPWWATESTTPQRSRGRTLVSLAWERRRGQGWRRRAMKSDPADALAAVRLCRATVQKMKQNPFWAAIYNVVAVIIAAGVLYPSFGVMLQPEFAALAMSMSSVTVVSNALLLRREV